MKSSQESKRFILAFALMAIVAACSSAPKPVQRAERNAGYVAAISISPAALSWEGNPLLQQRLVRAVQKIDIPVLLLQPAKDASLEPARILGAESARLSKRLTSKIYPATGPASEQAHCFGGAKGMHVWAKDAKAFLEERMR